MTNTTAALAEARQLRAEGMTFKAIGKVIGYSRSGVQYLLRAPAVVSENLYPLDGVTLPLETISGVMWRMPIKAQRFYHGEDCCEHCAIEDECRAHVAQGDFCGCERPLKREVVW